MTRNRQSREEPVPSEQVRAAAADWIAQLHDDQLSPTAETRFRAWLNESEDHSRAFDRMKDMWKLVGQLPIRPRGDATSSLRKHRSRFTLWAIPLAAMLVLAGVFIMYYSRNSVVATRVGQQQVRLLSDGTRILLNTDTRIEVDYDKHARRVRLIRGEAQFDVAKNPVWPFLVCVDGQEIRALGTSFIVRHDDIEDLAVTLVEGKISVTPITQNHEAPSQDPQILVPGQRLTISQNRRPTVDRPGLDHITAWERGEVDIANASLATAAKEMNRYSTRHLIIADADVSQLRVGGVFRAGHIDEFVSFVEATFGLQAGRIGSDIVLSHPSTAHPSSAGTD